MNSQTVPRFWQHYRRLPVEIRQEARAAYRQFSLNPRHPSLHFDRLKYDARFWSVRITHSYRAVGAVQGNTITWFWIGDHEDFDRQFPG